MESDYYRDFWGDHGSYSVTYDGMRSFSSTVDLLNRKPILLGLALAQDSNGIPMRLPDGTLVKDEHSPTGFLMGPPGRELKQVADAGHLSGVIFRSLLRKPFTFPGAFYFLIATLGVNLGYSGRFDDQREGSYLRGYIQHRQFQAISNVNVGLFAQQLGLPRSLTFWITGKFASLFSSNYSPSEPNGIPPINRGNMEKGYQIGETEFSRVP